MDVQEIVSLSLVALAAGALIRRLARSLRPARRSGGAACASGCGGCPAARPGTPPAGLVSLGPNLTRKRSD